MNHPGTQKPCNIFVISGPSGSGKSTLINRLMTVHPEIVFSVSHTTRPIRGKEVHGKDYYFVSKEHFSEMIEKDEFVEWAQVYDNFYGTGYKEVEYRISSKENAVLVLDIDVQGARNIKKKYPDAAFTLISPPSMAELRKRLVERENKEDQHIQRRLEIAWDELNQYRFYDYIIVNDDLDEAFSNLNAIYIAQKNIAPRFEPFMQKLLSSSF